jgi:hypothetical protein
MNAVEVMVKLDRGSFDHIVGFLKKCPDLERMGVTLLSEKVKGFNA